MNYLDRLKIELCTEDIDLLEDGLYINGEQYLNNCREDWFATPKIWGNEWCDDCNDTKLPCWFEEYNGEAYTGILKNPSEKNDTVNHPKHYTFGKYEVIDVIEDWNLDFRLANAVKYIARSAHKGRQKEDLEKAIWYIQRFIDKM